MNDVVKHLKQVRENIKVIEDILKKAGKQQETQIFISFKLGTKNEIPKEVQICDWSNPEGTTNYSTEIYKLMLEALMQQEDFWIRMANGELKELMEVLNKNQ